MSPEDLRDGEDWLRKLVGWGSPTPIRTAHDLRQYAREALCDAALTHAEWQEIEELAERLATPEEQQLTEERRQRSTLRLHFRLAKSSPMILRKSQARLLARFARPAQWKALAARGTAKRTQTSETTAEKAIGMWFRLEGVLEKRDRAAHISKHLRQSDIKASPEHVRRLLRKRGIK